jgi:hypothetical protein
MSLRELYEREFQPKCLMCLGFGWRYVIVRNPNNDKEMLYRKKCDCLKFVRFEDIKKPLNRNSSGAPGD